MVDERQNRSVCGFLLWFRIQDLLVGIDPRAKFSIFYIRSKPKSSWMLVGIDPLEMFCVLSIFVQSQRVRSMHVGINSRVEFCICSFSFKVEI